MKQLFLLLLFTLFFTHSFSLLAQTDPCVRTSEGREFWVGYMHNDPAPDPNIRLYVTSRFAATGTVFADGGATNVAAINVAANGSQTIELTPVNNYSVSNVQTVQNKGVFVSTSETVSLYALNRGTFTADATLIFPLNGLGTEYYTMSYAPGIRQSQFLVVGTQDGTTVSITPSANTTTGSPAGIPISVNLDRGQTYLVKSNADLTGSFIQGSNPIAVFSGNTRVNIDATSSDHVYEQIPPVNTWGRNFVTIPSVAAPGLTVRDYDYYKILAQRDGTVVTISGDPTSPRTLNAGEFYQFSTQGNNVPRVISSTEPILVGQFTISQQTGGENADPYFVLLSANEQTVKDINVEALEIVTGRADDFFITIVTKTTNTGNVRLNGANLAFTAITGSDMSFTRQAVTFGTYNIDNTLPTNEGFIAYVHGYAQTESYGYLAGSSLEIVVDVANDVAYCDGVTTDRTLEAPDGFIRYEWRLIPDPTILSINQDFTVSVSGSYELTTENAEGCIKRDTTEVIFSPPAIADIKHNGVSTDEIRLCDSLGQQTITGFNAANTPASEYKWRVVGSPTVIANTPDLVVNNFSATTVYELEVTNEATQCSLLGNGSAFDIITVIFEPTHDVNIAFDGTTPDFLDFCNSEGAQTITASLNPLPANVEYKWFKDGALIPTATTNTLTVDEFSATTRYKVEALRPNQTISCPQTDEIVVSFAAGVLVDISNNGNVVSGDTLILCDTEGAQTLSAFNPANPANVTYKWFARDSETDPLPTTLFDTTPTITADNFSDSTYYTVIITNINTPAFCNDTAHVTVFFRPQPVADIYYDEIIAPTTLNFCDDQGAQILRLDSLNNPDRVVVEWYDDDTNTLLADDVFSLVVDNFSSTLNIRVETTQQTCTDTDFIEVKFFPAAIIQHTDSISGDELFFCDVQGSQTIFGGYTTSTAIIGYQWRDITDPSNIIDLGTNIDLIANNFSDTTLYEVELIDIGNGLFPSCKLKDSVTVIFFGNQSAQIREIGKTNTPDTLIFCAADGARDLEIPVASILQPVTTTTWFELNGTTTTQIVRTPILNVNEFQANQKITKQYIARLTNTLTNCDVEDTMTVVFLPPIGVVLTGSTDICDGNQTPVIFRLSGAFPMKLTYREIPRVGTPTVREVYVGTETTTSPFDYVVQSTGGTFEVLALRDTLCDLLPVPSDIVEVTVTPKPEVLISSPDTSICVNQTTKFVAEGATSYVFYKNGLPMPAGAVANEYEPVVGTFQDGDQIWVIGETNGCPDTSRIMTMIVHPLPVVDLGVDRYKCKTDTALLVAPEGDFIYDWKKIDVDGSVISVGNGNDTLFALDTGTYFIRLENTITGCSTISNRVKIFNFDDEVVVDLGEDKTVCDPSDLPYRLVGSDLSHLNGTTYEWYVTGENTIIGSDSVLDVTAENMYSVVIQDPRGCRISDTVRINFAPTPDFVITGAENPNCSTFDTLRIERTNVRGMIINWFGDGIVSVSDSNKVAIVNVSGIYTATVTDTSTTANCSYTQSVEVFVRPNIDLGISTSAASDTIRLCEGDSLVLDAFRPEHNNNFTYQWRVIESNQTVSTNSKIAITYSMVDNYVANRFEVKVTDPNLTGGGNCSVLDTINVRFDRKSGVQIDSTFIKTLCLGQTQTLSAVGADSYQWSNGETTSTIEVTPTEAGFYTFIVNGIFSTPNLCGASADTIKFRVVPVPEIDIPESLVICENDSVEVNAFLPSHEPRYIYEWINENTGEIIDTLAIHVFKQDSANINYEPQTYRVGVYDTLGGGRCGAESLITVTFNRTSITEITASDTLVCIGEEITLRATGATNFRWNTGETTQEITISSDSAGVFRYTVIGSYGDDTNQNVCDSTGTSILVQFKDIPKITLNKPDTISICAGDSVQFIANGGFTYSWSQSPADSGDTVVVYPTDTTTYVVTGFDTLGCSSTDTTVVLVQPQIDLGQEQQLCEGDTASIGAPRPYGATYLWNTGETSDSIRIRRSGLYYVEVSINECSYTDSVQINFIEPPVLSAKDTILCFEDENQDRIFHQIGVEIDNYDSTARYRYQWFDENENLVGQDSLLNVEFGGVYLARVTVEYANSCSAITSLEVEANCDPQIFIPQAFTPNQDRLNEEWEIFGRFYSNLRIKVLDRWGMEVYSALQKRNDDEITFWDGTYKGKKVPAGVYYYEVTYTSPSDKSKTIKQTGTVTIIY
ncbi:gliding motility-associated C-terminal domain-containing protein [Bernardetia sp. OM2101]|uniref:gliding motility-associated C-terminal domain-containing protein n=1 Tax=Bernardetia sp. OM2101 TaxID=3344876 RepID=UPI0035CF36BA